MADIDPFGQYGLTRQQVDNAMLSLDGVRPLGAPAAAPPVAPLTDAAPAPGAVNTFQPLSPQEQAMGAAMAQQAAAGNANAAQAGYAHAPFASQAAPTPLAASAPGLDWQPPPQAQQPQAPVQGVFAGQPTSPGAQTGGNRSLSIGLDMPQLQLPQLNVPRGRGAATPKSPLPGMIKDASGRAIEAEGAANQAEDEQTQADQAFTGSQEDLGNARSEAQQGVAGIHGQIAADAEGHQKLTDDMNQGYQQAAYKTEQESREIADQIKNFRPRDQRTVGHRVANALAVFLGGVGDAFMAAGGQRGNNADGVVQLINQGIQRDLDEQQSILSNHKTALVAKNDELGHLYQRWGQSDAALKGAWLMKLDQAENSLKGVLASGASVEAKALANESIAKLQQQRSETERQLQMNLFQSNHERANQLVLAKHAEDRRAALAAANAPYANMKRQLELQKLYAETGKTTAEAGKAGAEAMKAMGEAKGLANGPYLGKDVQVTDPQAFQAWSASKPASASVEKLQQSIQGFSELRNSVGELRRLKSEWGSENDTMNTKEGRAAAAEMNAHREQVISSLGKLKDGSVIQEAEYKRWLDMVPGAGDYTDGAINQLNAIEQAAITRVNGTLRQVGASMGGPAAGRVRQGAAL